MPHVRQAHAAGGAAQKRRAEPLLEAPNRLAGRGWRDAEAPCCLGEAASLGHGHGHGDEHGHALEDVLLLLLAVIPVQIAALILFALSGSALSTAAASC